MSIRTSIGGFDNIWVPQSSNGGDIKPSNLLVSSDGTVKIADMGLALLQVESDLTTDGQVMGTVNYIAPEQIENAKRVDARTDLYSLGCTFYQLLSGRAPFDLPAHDGVLQKLRAHENSVPVPIAELRPDVPAEVAQIVTRLLAKQPQDRFASAAELVEAITPHAHGAHIAKLVRRAGGITEAEYSTDRIVAVEIDTSVVGNRTPRAGKSHASLEATGGASDRVTAAKNPTNRKVIVALLCAIGLLFAVNAPQLMRIATNKGVLVIENQDGVDVLITRGKKDPVTIRDKATNREYTLDVGDDYQLVIKEPKTGTEFTTETFSIKRNQETVFDAHAEMANSPVASRPAETTQPNQAPFTNASVDTADPGNSRQPANRETANLSERQLLEWLLLNGTKEIKAFGDDGREFSASKLDEIPRFLENPSKVWISFDILDQQPPPIPKLVSHASRLDLDIIRLFGEAPSAEVIASIAEVTKLGNVRFHGKFNFDNLAAIPAGAFQHARILLFREDLTDEAIPLIVSRFPNIERLNITNANLERFSDLSKLGSLRNIVFGHLTGTPTENLAQLPDVENLLLDFSYGLKTRPTVDLSHLPPNLKTLDIRNLTLTAEKLMV